MRARGGRQSNSLVTDLLTVLAVLFFSRNVILELYPVFVELVLELVCRR